MAYDDVRREPTSQLIHNVIDDVRELFREEVALARAEVREELGAWSTAAAAMAAGFAVAAVGGLFVLVAIALGAAALFGWPNWTGFLLVGVALAIAGFVALRTGRKRAATIVALPKTKETVRETSTWIKDRMTSKLQ
jgi:pilus assembly protein TadC